MLIDSPLDSRKTRHTASTPFSVSQEPSETNCAFVTMESGTRVSMRSVLSDTVIFSMRTRHGFSGTRTSPFQSLLMAHAT